MEDTENPRGGKGRLYFTGAAIHVPPPLTEPNGFRGTSGERVGKGVERKGPLPRTPSKKKFYSLVTDVLKKLRGEQQRFEKKKEKSARSARGGSE